MTRVSTQAQRAFSATRIYFAHDAPTLELTVNAVFHDADEFMPNGAFEPSIPARDFEICIADTGEQHPYEGFPGRSWPIDLPHCETLVFDLKS
jgi:hypothetical protein